MRLITISWFFFFKKKGRAELIQLVQVNAPPFRASEAAGLGLALVYVLIIADFGVLILDLYISLCCEVMREAEKNCFLSYQGTHVPQARAWGRRATSRAIQRWG